MSALGQKRTLPCKKAMSALLFSNRSVGGQLWLKPCPVVVLRPRTTPFYGITHIVEYKDREGRHALPLFGTKSFVEWLPRLCEFIQIG